MFENDFLDIEAYNETDLKTRTYINSIINDYKNATNEIKVSEAMLQKNEKEITALYMELNQFYFETNKTKIPVETIFFGLIISILAVCFYGISLVSILMANIITIGFYVVASTLYQEMKNTKEFEQRKKVFENKSKKNKKNNREKEKEIFKLMSKKQQSKHELWQFYNKNNPTKSNNPVISNYPIKNYIIKK